MGKIRAKVKARSPDPLIAPTISDQSFNVIDNAAIGSVVGIAQVSNVPNPAVTYAITAGNTNSDLAINVNTGSITIAKALNNGVTPIYNLTVQVSNSAGNASATVTVNVAAAGTDSLITLMTHTSNLNALRTNEIVEYGLPVGVSVFTSGKSPLPCYLVAGNQGTPFTNYQVDSTSTDFTGAIRFVKITAIVSSIAASATTLYGQYASPTTAVAGTPITLTDLSATEYRVVVNYDIAGVTATADTDNMYTASSTFNKATPWLSPTTFRSGPVCTEWVYRQPAMYGSSAVDGGDAQHVEFHIAAYKADPTAVSALNPIIAVRTDVLYENMNLVGTTATNLHRWYGLRTQRATGMSDATLISTDQADVDGNLTRFSYLSKQPDSTLIVNVSGTGICTLRMTSAAWDSDIKGAHIHGAVGKTIVTSLTNTSVATGYTYVAYTTVQHTQGNWNQYGIGQWSNGNFKQRVWVGQAPISQIIWGDCGNAVSATNSAPLAYVASQKMMLNHQIAYASSTWSMANQNLMTTSDGTVRPLTIRGVEGTYQGDIDTHIDSAGGWPYIGYQPGWAVKNFAQYTKNSRRALAKNADYFGAWQVAAPKRLSGSPATGALPQPPRADNGTMYNWSSGYGGTVVPQAARLASTFPPWNTDYAHQTSPFYAPYLATGDLWYLQRQQAQETYTTWMTYNSTYSGSGANKTAYGNALGGVAGNLVVFGNGPTRAKSWGLRDLVQATIMTPDTAKDTLYNAKSYYNSRVSLTWVAYNSYGPNNSGNAFTSATQPVWLFKNQRDGIAPYKVIEEAPWQVYYGMIVQGHANELGLITTAGASARDWSSRFVTAFPFDVSVVGDLTSNAYEVMIIDNAQITVNPLGWADMYQRSCWNAPRAYAEIGTYARIVSTTVSISDKTSGTGRQFLFSEGFFSSTPWYVNGYITQYPSGGIAQITAVVSGKEALATILTPFTSTVPNTNSIYIPGPKKADYNGYASVVTSSNGYAQYYAMSSRLMVDQGVSGAVSALNYMTGRDHYFEYDDFNYIAVR